MQQCEPLAWRKNRDALIRPEHQEVLVAGHQRGGVGSESKDQTKQFPRTSRSVTPAPPPKNKISSCFQNGRFSWRQSGKISSLAQRQFAAGKGKPRIGRNLLSL